MQVVIKSKLIARTLAGHNLLQLIVWYSLARCMEYAVRQSAAKLGVLGFGQVAGGPTWAEFNPSRRWLTDYTFQC
jgi:hypothetical protein